MLFIFGYTTEGKIAVDEDRSTPVFSPYAGRVTKLLARPGDSVTQGQPLFVIEAMKMESIVAAQQPGTVKQVVLKESTVVEQDDWVIEMA